MIEVLFELLIDLHNALWAPINELVNRVTNYKRVVENAILLTEEQEKELYILAPRVKKELELRNRIRTSHLLLKPMESNNKDRSTWKVIALDDRMRYQWGIIESFTGNVGWMSRGNNYVVGK